MHLIRESLFSKVCFQIQAEPLHTGPVELTCGGDGVGERSAYSLSITAAISLDHLEARTRGGKGRGLRGTQGHAYYTPAFAGENKMLEWGASCEDNFMQGWTVKTTGTRVGSAMEDFTKSFAKRNVFGMDSDGERKIVSDSLSEFTDKYVEDSANVGFRLAMTCVDEQYNVSPDTCETDSASVTGSTAGARLLSAKVACSVGRALKTWKFTSTTVEFDCCDVALDASSAYEVKTESMPANEDGFIHSNLGYLSAVACREGHLLTGWKADTSDDGTAHFVAACASPSNANAATTPTVRSDPGLKLNHRLSDRKGFTKYHYLSELHWFPAACQPEEYMQSWQLVWMDTIEGMTSNDAFPASMSTGCVASESNDAAVLTAGRRIRRSIPVMDMSGAVLKREDALFKLYQLGVTCEAGEVMSSWELHFGTGVTSLTSDEAVHAEAAIEVKCLPLCEQRTDHATRTYKRSSECFYASDNKASIKDLVQTRVACDEFDGLVGWQMVACDQETDGETDVFFARIESTCADLHRQDALSPLPQSLHRTFQVDSPPHFLSDSGVGHLAALDVQCSDTHNFRPAILTDFAMVIQAIPTDPDKKMYFYRSSCTEAVKVDPETCVTRYGNSLVQDGNLMTLNNIDFACLEGESMSGFSVYRVPTSGEFKQGGSGVSMSYRTKTVCCAVTTVTTQTYTDTLPFTAAGHTTAASLLSFAGSPRCPDRSVLRSWKIYCDDVQSDEVPGSENWCQLSYACGNLASELVQVKP